MIDPEKVTNYNQSDRELEEFILFWVCAAGKNGTTAARCLDKLLYSIYVAHKEGPFDAIRDWIKKDAICPTLHSMLPDMMKKAGIGCYNDKARTFAELVLSGIDLRTCTASDLEEIFGIGPKTARCFILHSRKDARVAGLDTHMLKHLRSLGFDAPKNTPTGKKYLDLEKIVLMLSDKAGTNPADYDLAVWNSYAVRS